MSTLPDSPDSPTLPVSRPPSWVNLPGAPVPALVGDFEIVSKLGEGSFGQVFLARQVSLGRNVALKVVRGPHAGDRCQPLIGLGLSDCAGCNK